MTPALEALIREACGFFHHEEAGCRWRNWRETLCEDSRRCLCRCAAIRALVEPLVACVEASIHARHENTQEALDRLDDALARLKEMGL